MKEFTLLGGTDEKDGKWSAEIKLTTPDGKVTRLQSDYDFTTEADAIAALEWNMDRILAEFNKDGVEVLSKNGLQYS